MVIVVGNGQADPSSNSGRGYLHIANALGKGIDPAMYPLYGNQSTKKKTLNSNLFNSA